MLGLLSKKERGKPKTDCLPSVVWVYCWNRTVLLGKGLVWILVGKGWDKKVGEH